MSYILTFQLSIWFYELKSGFPLYNENLENQEFYHLLLHVWKMPRFAQKVGKSSNFNSVQKNFKLLIFFKILFTKKIIYNFVISTLSTHHDSNPNWLGISLLFFLEITWKIHVISCHQRSRNTVIYFWNY